MSYLDNSAQPEQANFTGLPWTFTITTTVPAVIANVVAQATATALGVASRSTVRSKTSNPRPGTTPRRRVWSRPHEYRLQTPTKAPRLYPQVRRADTDRRVAADRSAECACAADRVGCASHAVTMSPQDAPAMIAAKRIGAKYHESDSDSIAMIVLESDKDLGDQAHRYYDSLVQKLQADPKHVQHVQNVWGDPLTAAGLASEPGRQSRLRRTQSGRQPGQHVGQPSPSMRCARSSISQRRPTGSKFT